MYACVRPCRLLTLYGSDVNFVSHVDGTTALWLAAREGRTTVAANLIECKADVDAPRCDADREPPLVAAATWGELSLLFLLLSLSCRRCRRWCWVFGVGVVVVVVRRRRYHRRRPLWLLALAVHDGVALLTAL